jgi:amino acid transporter
MGLISHSVSTTSTQDDASNDDCDVELTSLHHGEAHAAATKEPRRKKLNVATLAVLVFYSVSGGPYGSEASVRSAGNFYTLVGYIVAPCIWSIPEAIMTAELSSALPEAAGGVAWVEEAFGERAGWMAGYLGWIAGQFVKPLSFIRYERRNELI